MSDSWLYFIWGIVCWNIFVAILFFGYEIETENIKDRIKKYQPIYIDSFEYTCKVVK